MSEYLFVYGTLGSRFENDWARSLRENAKLLGPASVAGSLFRVGDYPAYRCEPNGIVYGELYELTSATRLFTLLDEYEGEQFMRVPITLRDGREAWIYRFESEPPAAARIECGDFSKA